MNEHFSYLCNKSKPHAIPHSAVPPWMMHESVFVKIPLMNEKSLMPCFKDIISVCIFVALGSLLYPNVAHADEIQYPCLASMAFQRDSLSPEKDIPDTPVGQKSSVWQGDYYPSVFYFPIDKHKLMSHYQGNKVMLHALDEHLRAHYTTAAIDTVEIIGACSPVGGKKYNMKLAARRCKALSDYIEENHPHLFETIIVHYNVIGVDSLGYDILRQKEPTLTQKQLWDNLQYVAIRLKMKDGTRLTPGIDVPVEKDTTAAAQIIERSDTIYLTDTLYVELAPAEPAPKKKPIYLAVKTNLLYEALLVPNLSIEWYMGSKWSLMVQGNWCWWTLGSKPENRWYHRIQAAGVELRRWIRSPHPLQGHAVGLYAMLGDYDLRHFPKDESSRGTLSRRSYSAGVSYAYSFPIRRRLNLEVGLSGGYVGGTYYKYTFLREEKYGELLKFNRNYFGPTGINLSLVWVLGAGNSKK